MIGRTNSFATSIVICMVLFTVLCIAVYDINNNPPDHVTPDPLTVSLGPNDTFVKEIGPDEEQSCLVMSIETVTPSDDDHNVTIIISLNSKDCILKTAVFSCAGNVSMDGKSIHADSSLEIKVEELYGGTQYGSDDNPQMHRGTGFVTDFRKPPQSTTTDDYITQHFQMTMFEDRCKLRMNMFLTCETTANTYSINQDISIEICL